MTEAYIDAAHRDAVENVAVEIIDGIKRAMLRHGTDPDAIAIIILGIDAAAREITKEISPVFRMALLKQLAKERAAS